MSVPFYQGAKKLSHPSSGHHRWDLVNKFTSDNFNGSRGIQLRLSHQSIGSKSHSEHPAPCCTLQRTVAVCVSSFVSPVIRSTGDLWKQQWHYEIITAAHVGITPEGLSWVVSFYYFLPPRVCGTWTGGRAHLNKSAVGTNCWLKLAIVIQTASTCEWLGKIISRWKARNYSGGEQNW